MIWRRSAYSSPGTPPQVAAIFADRILRATDRLSSNPRLGRIVPELEIDNIREVLVGSHRIIYRMRKEAVEILTTHHGARPLDLTRVQTGA